MKTFPASFLRPALLAAAGLLLLPLSSPAANPLKNIGGKIKNGVSNVGSAIKNTAKAAKDIVTPGKAAEKPAPRATAVPDAKPRRAATAAPTSAKSKKPAAKPEKSTAATGTKTKPKSPENSSPSAKAKPRAKDKPQVAAKAKPTKKTVPREDEEEDSPRRKKSAEEQEQTSPEKDLPSSIPVSATTSSSVADSGDNGPAESTGGAPAREELPFGTPAFGRKGFVYSPFAPDQGLIDVVSVPAGAKVRCPYTGKPFRVP